ncbi:hypothetical protein JNUCC64_31890 [Streptomyces sp. JNUCC 64]
MTGEDGRPEAGRDAPERAWGRWLAPVPCALVVLGGGWLLGTGVFGPSATLDCGDTGQRPCAEEDWWTALRAVGAFLVTVLLGGVLWLLGTLFAVGYAADSARAATVAGWAGACAGLSTGLFGAALAGGAPRSPVLLAALVAAALAGGLAALGRWRGSTRTGTGTRTGS